MRINAVYRHLCPNCGGPISSERLSKGLPCRDCLESEVEGGWRSISRALDRLGRLRGYAWLSMFLDELDDFISYFRAKTGREPWSAQRSWASRLLLGQSFAIIAPTGVGKTTLLLVYASYVAESRGWRVLYLVPTENLARQVYERLESITGGVVAYYSSLPKKRREEVLDAIRRGDYKILVVTTGFLQRRFDLVAGNSRFDLVVVDDVDSLLRNSRNVERVLASLGVPSHIVEAASKLVEAKLRLYRAVSSGNERVAGALERRIAELNKALSTGLSGFTGQLVIASATGRPRGYKHLVFREILGFEVGGSSDYMRNVIDSYVVSGDYLGALLSILPRLRGGTLVFVSSYLGKAYAKIVASELERRGYRVGLSLAGSRRQVDRMARGEIDILVGVASRYGAIVRGIDLPERIYNAVFLGVPAVRVRLEEALYSPRRLYRLLLYAEELGEGWAGEAASRVRIALDRIEDPVMASLALRGRISPEGRLKESLPVLREAYERLLSWFRESFRGRARIDSIVIEERGGDLWVYIPDPLTYIQASGRTSRLYKGAMTLGLSIIVERVEDLVRALEERMAFTAKTRFVPLESLDLDAINGRLEESRRSGGRRINVKTALLLVESPTKARTVAWFWGRPAKRRVGRHVVYETSMIDEDTNTVYLLSIAATRGHLFDLAVDEDESLFGVRINDGYSPVYTSIKRCLDCGSQYTNDSHTCPNCGSPMTLDSMTVVSLLRKLAVEVDEVLIATDPDREGEKIAWDLYLALKPYNERIYRVEFHEVTPKAVVGGIRGRRSLRPSLVEAQIVRRIFDRWIGFTLSSHLKLKYKARWMGAGRVQTPVLGWIVGRYREWEASRGYKVVIRLRGGGRIAVFTDSLDMARSIAGAGHVDVVRVDAAYQVRSPPPPFTTDSLLYEASNRLGYNSRMAMRLVQDLFESGLITYHRTDSTRVSSAGIAVAMKYLESKGISVEASPRGWGEGGAHEAIRPTRPIEAEELERRVYDGSLKVPIKLTRHHIRLYDLIFRRFIASQMRGSRVAVVRAELRIGGARVGVEGITGFEGGFMRIYRPQMSEWLSSLKPGSRLPVEESRIYRSSRVSLLRSGDVVRLMKEAGIGRPSTYSKAIEANLRHGYVVESKRMKYLVPTKTGIEVYTYLSSTFSDLVSVDTTRRLEEILDSVEMGAEPSAALDGILSMIYRAGELRMVIEASPAGEVPGMESG